MWTIRAKQVVLACGSHERHSLSTTTTSRVSCCRGSAGNLSNAMASLRGGKCAICTNNDDGYNTAMRLTNAGVEVRSVADARTNVSGCRRSAREAGFRWKPACCPQTALGGSVSGSICNAPTAHSRKGRLRLHRYVRRVFTRCASGQPDRRSPVWREKFMDLYPTRRSGRERSAGAGTATFDLAACLAEGTPQALTPCQLRA